MVQYKKFKLDSLFDIQKVRGINKSGLTEPSDSECYDYITRTSKNNGIESQTGLVEARELNEAGTFSLGLLQMTFFYRDKPWYAGQFVRKIVPKRPMTQEQLLYFLGAFQALRPLLSSVLVRKVDETFANAKIELPVTSMGEPDLAYMTMRIRELEAERIRELKTQRIRELDAYLSVTGLNDTTLSASEAQALTQQVQLQKFRIGDMFDIEKVRGVNKSGLTTPTVDDSYDYITRTAQNNGIESITGSVNDRELNSAGTISLGLLQMTFFYRDRPWYAGQFVRKIVPKLELTKEQTLYFVALFNALRPMLLGVLVRNIDETFLNTELQLPVTATGEIDFDYMQDYIRAMEKETIKGVVEYKDKVIEETKKVVNG